MQKQYTEIPYQKGTSIRKECSFFLVSGFLPPAEHFASEALLPALQ
ncbi:hypothetical protein lbkm_0432 [Lachnospiraceae bacterium KM106-2]|nr:hypothetical protein lbkm_0432 [Lachnospiraceae bacterium KM106-2]